MDEIIAQLFQHYGPAAISWVFVVMLWRENKQLTKDLFESKIDDMRVKSSLIHHLKSLKTAIKELS